MGGIKAHYDCIKAFSETAFKDLKMIDVPTLYSMAWTTRLCPSPMPGRYRSTS